MAEKVEVSEPTSPEEEPAGRVLQVVRELAIELHPQRKDSLRVGLESRLDRDLALDSLARAELLLRLERAFDVQLPQELLSEAETPEHFLAAVLGAEPSGRLTALATTRPPPLGPAEGAPLEARTLTEVLDWHVESHPDRPHIRLLDGAAEEQTITYRGLADDARAVARGLARWGLEPGQRVAIMLPTGEAFFSAFFGILYAGGVAVPIYPPTRPSQLEDHLRRQAAILSNAGAVMLITVPEARTVAILLKSHVVTLRAVETVERLRLTRGAAEGPAARGGADTALLQYTSGSTGDPKGVVLSHANLVANVRAMGEVMEADSSDLFVSWLPLYHDMGLIGAWLATLYFAVPTVIMSPLSFLARPASWLWAIHRHRGTLSGAPNFAFELCLRKIDDRDLEGLDLSSLRMVINGAEPVSPATIREFTERFKKYGFRATAMAPCFGLAESTVGLAFPPAGRAPIVDHIRRQQLVTEGRAIPATAEEADVLDLVACGQPLTGQEFRVVDGTGRELGERREGRLQFRGTSSTSGYFRNPAKTAELFAADGWLETGDLAYIAGGDLFLTGREKDIMIRAGRNIYPQELEAAVGNIEGVRRGCVAVFGSADPVSGTERIVVVAETRERDHEARARLRQRINEASMELLDTPPDEVVLAPPHSVLKTSSGKLRRSASRELYEQGRLGAAPRSLWWQFARLGGGALLARARSRLRAAGELAYAGYWWAVIALAVAVVWPLVVALPRPSWRWAVLRGAARLTLRLTGTPLTVDGTGPSPAAGGVVVANHSSYLDGLVLVAALPGELAFVAKQELASHIFTGPFLRRIGTLFVRRFDPESGIEDTHAVLDAARAGRRPMFFPEGTLTRRPGLLAFRLGAFTVAAEAGVPVTPVTIRGTRSVLRDDDKWFPRHGSVEIGIGAPLAPDGEDWAAAIRLRDKARAEILGRCGEPDLAEESAALGQLGAEPPGES
jgi:1-acyl-sn-glycerol-3-phosphate acyltransferase